VVCPHPPSQGDAFPLGARGKGVGFASLNALDAVHVPRHHRGTEAQRHSFFVGFDLGRGLSICETACARSHEGTKKICVT
jgi:hypothetical protein